MRGMGVIYRFAFLRDPDLSLSEFIPMSLLFCSFRFYVVVRISKHAEVKYTEL